MHSLVDIPNTKKDSDNLLAVVYGILYMSTYSTFWLSALRSNLISGP